MTKDKVVFVRLTNTQTRLIDQIVRDMNKKTRDVGKTSRSDVIRLAVEAWISKVKPKDPELLSTVFESEGDVVFESGVRDDDH